MKEITKEQLSEIIKNHQHWLKKDCEGWEEMRAELDYIKLKDIDFTGVNLSGASLVCADLSGSIFDNANLSKANLSCSNLSDITARWADFRCCKMIKSNLYFADISDSDLSGADLSGANMRNADTSGTNMRGCEFLDTIYNN